jgi:HAMP domain-containing protein
MRGADGVGHLEHELMAERAAALARIAETLEGHLSRLRRAAARLEAGTGAAEPREARDAYPALRAAARRWRWYLEVQREAVGFLRHDDLDRLYPLPPEPAEAR